MAQALPFSKTEKVLKALFLESKYSKLLTEITAQRKLFPSDYDYWKTYFRIAQYQTVCQRIITANFFK